MSRLAFPPINWYLRRVSATTCVVSPRLPASCLRDYLRHVSATKSPVGIPDQRSSTRMCSRLLRVVVLSGQPAPGPNPRPGPPHDHGRASASVAASRRDAKQSPLTIGGDSELIRDRLLQNHDR